MDKSINQNSVSARTPLVSIIMTTYNQAHFLESALSSVVAQTFTNWECLIMDDASTDNTSAVAQACAQNDPRIIYIQQKSNLGIARNRNSGLSHTRGTYIAVLDCDDLWIDKDKLEKQVKHLHAHPEAVLVGTHAQTIDSNGAVLNKKLNPPTTDRAIRASMLSTNAFIHSSVVYRANTARDCGGYDEAHTIGEDYSLWLALGLKGTFANLPDCMVSYRMHNSSITKQKKILAAQEHLSIIRKYAQAYPYYYAAAFKRYVQIGYLNLASLLHL